MWQKRPANTSTPDVCKRVSKLLRVFKNIINAATSAAAYGAEVLCVCVYVHVCVGGVRGDMRGVCGVGCSE